MQDATRSLLKKFPKNTYNKIMISTSDTSTFHSTFPVGTAPREELMADKGRGAAMSSSCEPDLCLIFAMIYSLYHDDDWFWP